MLRTVVATGSAVLLGLAVLVPTGLPASASPDRGDVEERQDEVQQGLDSSQDDLEHVNGELVAASERLADLQTQLPAARQAVDSAQAAAVDARDRDEELAEELVLAEAAVVSAGFQLDERTGQADATERVVAGVAREVYQGSGFTPLSILVEAESAREYADMVSFAAVARRSQEQALSRLRVQQSDIRNAEARLQAERVRVDDLKVLAAEQVVLTEAAEQAAQDAEAQLQTLVVAEDQAVAAFDAARVAEENEIAALEAESQQLEAQLVAIAEAERQAELARQAALERARQAEIERQAELARVAEDERQALIERQAAEQREAEEERQEELERARERAERENRPPPRDTGPAPAPAPPPRAEPEPDDEEEDEPERETETRDEDPEPPSSGSYLSDPVNARISSSFGYRIHPILGYRKLHAGTDFAASCGTPVRAAADGRVVSAGWGGGYGNLVVIAHGIVDGDSLATAYAHLSEYEVRSGSVSRGDVIGYIGTTGSSTGCHLHFETRVNGTAVDAMGYL